MSHYHNKQFNFVEPDICKLSILKDASLETEKPRKQESDARECLFEDHMEQINCPICLEDIFTDGKKPNPPIMRSSDRQYEQQWDSVNQDFNITILCCHTFNWRCLVGWGGHETNQVENEEQAQTCPLCRYY